MSETETYPEWLGKYWIKTWGNGQSIEIGKRGNKRTVYMQDDEAADFIAALDKAREWGRASTDFVFEGYF